MARRPVLIENTRLSHSAFPPSVQFLPVVALQFSQDIRRNNLQPLMYEPARKLCT